MCICDNVHVRLCVRRDEPAYVAMLAPFLGYLYCEPQRQAQHALLRHSLLRVLLPSRPGGEALIPDQERSWQVSDSLLCCLYQLVPHMQVRPDLPVGLEGGNTRYETHQEAEPV